MSTANPTVRRHLQRVVDLERRSSLLWLTRLRASLVSLYTLQMLWYLLFAPDPTVTRSFPVFIMYTFVTGVYAVVAELSPKAARLAGYTLGLIDMPMIALACLVALPVMPNPPELAYSLLPFPPLLIIITALSIDYRAIAVSTVAATLGTSVVMLQMVPPSELVDIVFAIIFTGITTGVVVSRIRALVEESRRKDFAGKYVLGERIGVGGMAEVFSATYSPAGSFERRVAVKRILPAFASNTEFMALFRREAEVGAQLAHPNLVQVLDFGQHGDAWFIAMEFIEGLSLAELQKSIDGKPLPVEVCLYVIGELAEALTYLHEKRSNDGANQGLVHRDLNPPNVLLSHLGEVKVADFGIARWTNGELVTRTGNVRGKLGYAAPEYLQGSAASPAGDLFALGVVAWELLVGRRLFFGSEQMMLEAVLNAPIELPSKWRPQVPPSIDAIVAQLLEREPSKRLESARFVSNAVRSVTGPQAPYPTGRAALVSLLPSVVLHSAVSAPEL